MRNILYNTIVNRKVMRFFIKLFKNTIIEYAKREYSWQLNSKKLLEIFAQGFGMNCKPKLSDQLPRV